MADNKGGWSGLIAWQGYQIFEYLATSYMDGDSTQWPIEMGLGGEGEVIGIR